jgi:glycosyltransferase involved in cell wall biosynthesis
VPLFRKIAVLVTEDWFALSHFVPLIETLKQHANELVVITRDTGRASELEALGVRVIPVDYHRSAMNPVRELATSARLARLLRRERPDVTHLIAMKPIVLGGLASRMAGVPAIAVHMTGLGFLVTDASAKTRPIKAVVLRHVAGLINRRRSWLFVENPDDLQFLKDNGANPGARVSLLGGAGVDADAMPALQAPTNHPPVAAYAGRMILSKGIDTLIAAKRLLDARGVPLSVSLFGRLDFDNPEAVTEDQIAAWEEAADTSSGTGTVKWHGHTDDLAGVWAAADIFVLAAKEREGMPRAMLEAAACGRPLIVTDIPGCRHFVRDGIEGRVIPPNDPAALADALSELAASPELRVRMGQAARDRLLSGFTTGHVQAAITDAYATLAADLTDTA